ncbi:MAG: hypothetical protein ACYCVD_18360 [Desulfitobacteriaceae bacterium]
MKKLITSLMTEELERANSIHGTSFNSPHEGYAIMLEEMDELFDEIKKKNPDQERMRDEAIQVGAMAMKFIMSLENWSWLGLKMSAKELKCLRCSYSVLTADELADVGSDPCLTCNGNSNNWQPKRDTCDDCGGVVILNGDDDFFLESGTYGIPKGHHSKMVCGHCYETKYTWR